jgi:radical SAM protein with 4Fe4S-binding SPASM domain
MELALNTSMSRHSRGDNFLYIFGNVPYWFVANKQLDPIIRQLEKGVEQSDLFSKISIPTQSLITDLVKMGIISQDGKTMGDIERLEPKKRVWDTHDVAEFELTLNCNLRCKHCYIDAGKSQGDEISIPIIRRTLDDLVDIHGSDMRAKRIVLTGGEPFIRKDIIDVVNMIKERGFRTLINSNGLLITENHLNQLRDYKGLQICVSLDGTKESHERIRGIGTYELTLRQIRKISGEGIGTAINMLCHQGNYTELSKVIDDTIDIDLQGVNPVPVVSMGRANDYDIEPVPEKDLFREILQLQKNPAYSQRMTRISLLNFMGALACNVKSHYCGTGTRGTFFISYKGDVYPCPNMRDDLFRLGNVNTEPLKKIIEGNPVIESLGRLNVDDMNDQCPKCDVKYFCGGYCRGETFFNTRDIKAPYIRCGEYKEGILEAMWELSANPKLYEAKAKEFLEKSRKRDESK